MNEEIKQILENQKSIMNAVNLIMVNNTTDSGDIQRQIIEDYEKTNNLLNPEIKPSISERIKEATTVR